MAHVPSKAHYGPSEDEKPFIPWSAYWRAWFPRSGREPQSVAWPRRQKPHATWLKGTHCRFSRLVPTDLGRSTTAVLKLCDSSVHPSRGGGRGGPAPPAIVPLAGSRKEASNHPNLKASG
eukprot:5071737-Amphidinium_carterae.1